MEPSIKKALERIHANASEVRAAATELTKKVNQFEAWLSKVPGRVAASVSVYESDEGEVEHLGFQRVGNEWALVTFSYYLPSDTYSAPQLLRDASMSVKAQMVPNFAKLLEAMAEQQECQAKYAREVSRKYDAFAAELGIKEGA